MDWVWVFFATITKNQAQFFIILISVISLSWLLIHKPTFYITRAASTLCALLYLLYYGLVFFWLYPTFNFASEIS